MKKLCILLSLLSLLVLLTSCVSFGSSFYFYDNADMYTAGSGSADKNEISRIEIDWIDGEVIVEYADTEEITFSDGDSYVGDDKMHYAVMGSTLKIKYCGSGIKIDAPKDKTLTVRIPEGLDGISLDVECVSSELTVGDLSLRSLDAETVSGNVYINKTVIEHDLSVSGVSAKLSLLDVSAPSSISLETVSGKVAASFLSKIDELELDTVSGDGELTFTYLPNEADLDTTSGDISLIFSRNDGFTLELDKVSGDIVTDIDLTLRRGEYIYGDGGKDINVDTVSGDLKLELFYD